MRDSVPSTRLNVVLVGKWILKLVLAPLLAPLFLIAGACWICVWFTGSDTGTDSPKVPKAPSNLGDIFQGVRPLPNLSETQLVVCPS